MQTSSRRPARYPLRSHLRDVIESKVFSASMLTIIFVNTFLIALQTDQIAQMKVGAMPHERGYPSFCTTTLAVSDNLLRPTQCRGYAMHYSVSDWYLSVLDNVFLGIYILELQLKLYVHRGKFFASGWNNFGPLQMIE